MALTDTRIRNTKPTGKLQKLTDSRGLYLEVSATGSRLWRYRFRIDGKENTLALGRYPDMSLRDAREARDGALKLISAGINPALDRKQAKQAKAASNRNTFQAVAEEWLEQFEKKGCAPKSLTKRTTALKAYIYPVLGKRPISGIKASELLAILKRVDEGGAPTTAIYLRQWCSSIFRYAVVTLRAEHDPAALLQGAIVKPRTQHKKPLDSAGLVLFYQKMRADSGAYAVTKVALELLALLFVRTGELRCALWAEFDLEGAVWNIPAERMKGREAHVVPLSRQALELLHTLKRISWNTPFLFPNMKGNGLPMAAQTLIEALNRMGMGRGSELGFSPHGFRATASTMLNEMGYHPDIIERQLAHKEPNAVRRAYNRAQYLPERVAMMQAWADFLDTCKAGSGNVIPLRQAGRKT
jgi:integrase